MCSGLGFGASFGVMNIPGEKELSSRIFNFISSDAVL